MDGKQQNLFCAALQCAPNFRIALQHALTNVCTSQWSDVVLVTDPGIPPMPVLGLPDLRKNRQVFVRMTTVPQYEVGSSTTIPYRLILTRSRCQQRIRLFALLQHLLRTYSQPKG